MACMLLERTPEMRRVTLGRIAKRSRGFTLIELGVVVAIIGILAVIAIVGYRKMILTSKLTEAETMINSIRIAEEDYKAESGVYLDVSGAYCPTDGTTAGNTNKKWAWDTTTCNNGKWGQLPVHADGPVQFGYAVYAGTTVTQPPGVSQQLIDLSRYAGARMPYYVVHAQAELDDDATNGFSQLAGSSFTGHIYTLNEGR